MNAFPGNDDADTDPSTEAMQTALKGDVANWAAARNEAAGQTATEFRPAPPRRAAPATATTKKAKAAAVVAAPAAPAVKKPFKMSYDGVTTAQHIQYMIDNGAR